MSETAAPPVHRETLLENDAFRLQRNGRFLLAELRVPHLVLSTCVRNGGLQGAVRYLLNHQSCEAVAHVERHEVLHARGLRAYHDVACDEAGVDRARVALMGTAANMNYASVVTHASEGLAATAVVTAGVGGNAACAGDPTTWAEGEEGFRKVLPYAGTINTMVLLDRPLAPNAMLGAVMVLAEAKAAALQRLAIRSRYSRELATGTTTDQFCVACRREPLPPLASASTGVRAGEVIGRAVRDATLEALRWQNGLEPSTARSLFHALSAYGLREETFLDDIAPFLAEAKLALLRANRNAVVFEPLAAGAAYALAGVLDRLRHGILPVGAAKEALRQQAANLAAGLAARPERWPEFYREVGEVDPERPLRGILAAIAIGWSAKWP